MFELICDDWSIIKIIEEELFDMRKIYKINGTYKHVNTWILNLKTYFSCSIWQCQRCFTLLSTKDKKVINTWNKNGELAPEDILCRYINSKIQKQQSQVITAYQERVQHSSNICLQREFIEQKKDKSTEKE